MIRWIKKLSAKMRTFNKKSAQKVNITFLVNPCSLLFFFFVLWGIRGVVWKFVVVGVWGILGLPGHDLKSSNLGNFSNKST